jgi:hypothetical protein
MLFSSLLTLFGLGFAFVPGMGREEPSRSEGIALREPEPFPSNEAWGGIFLRHYI